jgi:hypothetical protein
MPLIRRLLHQRHHIGVGYDLSNQGKRKLEVRARVIRAELEGGYDECTVNR